MLAGDVSGRVFFRAWMPHEELAAVLDEHGIFLFPTIAEGFGRAGLEAMSRGLCVVASDCCGMRDYIVHRSNGFLCPTGSVRSFVTMVREILDSDSLARSIYSAARETSLRYTWRNVAGEMAEYLTELKRSKSRGNKNS
jgi:glycosyltransferase involved in cell wall biosynthesis